MNHSYSFESQSAGDGRERLEGLARNARANRQVLREYFLLHAPAPGPQRDPQNLRRRHHRRHGPYSITLPLAPFSFLPFSFFLKLISGLFHCKKISLSPCLLVPP